MEVVKEHATPPSNQEESDCEEDVGVEIAVKLNATQLKNKKRKEAQKRKKLLLKENPEADLLSGFKALSINEAFNGPLAFACNELKGRHVVANCDIPAGIVILDQEPYSAVVKDAFVENICHKCFMKCNFTFVCADCKFARYCSQNCMKVARKEHGLECKTLKK